VVGSGANAQVDLFAVSYTSGNGDPDGLFSISDSLDATTGAGESFTEVESAAGNSVDNQGGELFKGVAFAPAVPEPGTLSLLSIGSVTLLKRRRGISPRSTQRALR
jgi:hypothetical protein